MNKNMIVLLVSVVIGILNAMYVQQPCEGEGLSCVGIGLGRVFFGVIIIPIVFGVLGYVISSEKKLKRAFSWLGISFGVILVINLLAAQLI
jgi:hypothetical protein